MRKMDPNLLTLYSYFNSIKKGLRQGDPLSPFLFILVMEGLHVAIKDACQANLIKGVTVGTPGIRLSHFFYADDVKSNVYGIGVSPDDIEQMAQATDCSAGTMPFTYLGLPIGVNMNSLNSCQDKDKKKTTWVKWENILASREKGGLGIGSLKAFNQALLQKWRWRLHSNPNQLWVHVIKAVYGEDAGFDHIPSTAKGIWRNIVGSINHLHDSCIVPKDTMKHKVRCGTKVRFWIDTWIGDGPLAHR
ncbi:hypothetical protein Tco_0870601, partial [Tanacetum coccineum]